VYAYLTMLPKFIDPNSEAQTQAQYDFRQKSLGQTKSAFWVNPTSGPTIWPLRVLAVDT
jgi:hypothetical protein